MRKNLTALLRKGDIKPKDRVLLLVRNEVSEDKDGKSILTEADKHALGEGWQPKDNYEVKEYNRYNEGWRFAGFAELDAQTTFLNAEVAFLRANRLVDYAFLHNLEIDIKTKKDYESLNLNIFDFYKRLKLEDIGENEALQLIVKNSGLEFDNVVYTYAFEGLSKDLKRDILALEPDAKTESQYLDQEEIIAGLFNGKNRLTKEAKEKLADLIVDILYNPYFKKWWFSGFYAEIPTLEILKKWADYNKISYEVSDKDLAEAEKKQKEAKTVNNLIAGDKSLDTKEGKELRKEKLIPKVLTERIKSYAEKHKADIGDLLKQTILRWLDDGLLINEYTPLFNSNTKETCHDTDTKLPHKEVFKEWLKAKKEAKQTLQELIDKGELKVENRDREFLGVKKILKIITGESLYNLKGDFAFAKDFKKQADVFKGLGFLILFLQGHKFMKDYAILLSFEEIFKKLSKIYEIDLTYKINKWIEGFKENIEQLNYELTHIAERIDEAVYLKHNIAFLKETFIEDMLISLEKIKPSRDRVEKYFEEFSRIFGDEF